MLIDNWRIEDIYTEVDITLDGEEQTWVLYVVYDDYEVCVHTAKIVGSTRRKPKSQRIHVGVCKDVIYIYFLIYSQFT
jgi:hypothetical protein